MSGDLNHGTHVAGIAAGNGVPGGCEKPGTFIGVAPEAHLVIVKTGVGGDRPGISNLADAATYIFEVAKMAQCPAVVNISLASHQGPHNGHSVYARVFDMLTSGADGIGRAIVIAAGNDRERTQACRFHDRPRGAEAQNREFGPHGEGKRGLPVLRQLQPGGEADLRRPVAGVR